MHSSGPKHICHVTHVFSWCLFCMVLNACFCLCLLIWFLNLQLLISPYKVFGSFANIPAVICVDDVKCDLTMALSFLHTCNVLQTIANPHGVVVESTLEPMCIPTVNSWYNSWQTFWPIYQSRCDVELGCDWLASVNLKFDVDGSWLPRPSKTEVGQLSGGHRSSQPKDMCMSFKSLIHAWTTVYRQFLCFVEMLYLVLTKRRRNKHLT
jgi:hypothetical protein